MFLITHRYHVGFAGGGLYSEQDGTVSDASVTISNSTFTNNFSWRDGGAIYHENYASSVNYSRFRVQDSAIVNNTALGDGNVFVFPFPADALDVQSSTYGECRRLRQHCCHNIMLMID